MKKKEERVCVREIERRKISDSGIGEYKGRGKETRDIGGKKCMLAKDIICSTTETKLKMD